MGSFTFLEAINVFKSLSAKLLFMFLMITHIIIVNSAEKTQIVIITDRRENEFITESKDDSARAVGRLELFFSFFFEGGGGDFSSLPDASYGPVHQVRISLTSIKSNNSLIPRGVQLLRGSNSRQGRVSKFQSGHMIWLNSFVYKSVLTSSYFLVSEETFVQIGTNILLYLSWRRDLIPSTRSCCII